MEQIVKMNHYTRWVRLSDSHIVKRHNRRHPIRLGVSPSVELHGLESGLGILERFANWLLAFFRGTANAN